MATHFRSLLVIFRGLCSKEIVYACKHHRQKLLENGLGKINNPPTEIWKIRSLKNLVFSGIMSKFEGIQNGATLPGPVGYEFRVQHQQINNTVLGWEGVHRILGYSI